MRDYTKIEAWRLADDLTVAVYGRTRAFPREKIYGLTAQCAAHLIQFQQTSLSELRAKVRGTISIFFTSRVVPYPRPNIFSTLRSDSVIYHRKKPTIFGSKRR